VEVDKRDRAGGCGLGGPKKKSFRDKQDREKEGATANEVTQPDEIAASLPSPQWVFYLALLYRSARQDFAGIMNLWLCLMIE
jgi:hypothetical protein